MMATAAANPAPGPPSVTTERLRQRYSDADNGFLQAPMQENPPAVSNCDARGPRRQRVDAALMSRFLDQQQLVCKVQHRNTTASKGSRPGEVVVPRNDLRHPAAATPLSPGEVSKLLLRLSGGLLLQGVPHGVRLPSWEAPRPNHGMAITV
jgi:hypothetical protein